MEDTATKIELTDREIALCQGIDPDCPVVESRQEADAKDSGNKDVASATDANTVEQPPKDGGPDGAGGKDAAGSSWLKPEHVELAKNVYGLSDDDLKDFSSEEEFTKATRLLDRSLLSAVRNAKSEPATNTAPAQPAAPQPTQQQTAQQQIDKVGIKKLDLEKLKADGYDDHSLELFANHNALVDFLEAREKENEGLRQRFSAFEQAAIQAEQIRRTDAFHDAVDSIGDGRFGKSIGPDGTVVKLSEAEEASRKKLWDTVEELGYGIAARQRANNQPVQLPPLPDLVRRAREVAFAEDLRKAERKQYQDSVMAQSAKRRPVAASRGVDGRFAKSEPADNDPASEAKAIANNPALVAMWNKFQEQNGAV